VQNIVDKFKSLPRVQLTDRQTDDRRTAHAVSWT